MQCFTCSLVSQKYSRKPFLSALWRFESAYHLFFICPAYVATRSYLPDNIHEYSLKDLLYGTQHGTGHANETLFLKVQDFLTNFGRFNHQS